MLKFVYLKSYFIVLTLALSSLLLHQEFSIADELNCQQELLKSDNQLSSDRFKKGYCYKTVGDYEKAFIYLNGLEKELSELNDYILFFQAESLKELGKTKDASTKYKKILNSLPSNIIKNRSLENLAEIFVEKGKLQQAADIYKTLVESEDSSWIKAEYLNKIGELSVKQNDYTSAYYTYKQIWINYPQTTYSTKIYELTNRIETNFIPYQSERLERANNLFELSLWQPALSEYLNVSSSYEVNTKIGICLYRLGKYRQSYELLKELSTPQALYWEGRALEKLGKLENSTKTLISIHNIFPTDREFASKGLYKAAIIEQKSNRTANAINIYKTLLKQYPFADETPAAAWNLGRIYYKKGLYTDALDIFSSYTYPQDSFNSQSFQYWRAKTLEKLGRKLEARNTYKSIALSPKYTYHSFLARKKIGYEPKVIKSNSPIIAFLQNKNWPKADLLIEFGLYDFARKEIEDLEKQATTDEEIIYVSSLYSKIKDYYTSVNLVQKFDHPSALSISFPEAFSDQVRTLSIKYRLDELLVYSLIREESRFNKDAVSRSNARGLMQLIPLTAGDTANKVGIDPFNIDMLFDPKTNVELGTYYLRYVLDRFNGEIPLALAGYNAGPNRVSGWLEDLRYSKVDEFIEEIPFTETRNYVKRILRSYGAYRALYGN